MIEIKYTNNGNTGCIEITGHANYAEHGKDIVCSAVSALSQTLIASIEKLEPEADITYNMQPGFIKLIHGNLSEKMKTLIDSFFIGVKMVAEQYPDYVKVKERN